MAYGEDAGSQVQRAADQRPERVLGVIFQETTGRFWVHEVQGNSPSATASAASDVKRPKITLPKSLQVAFSGWTNSDPRLQAILDDGRQQLLGS